MIIASINGIPGIGFAEASCNGGPTDCRGKIRVTAGNAHRLQRLIDERAALVYNGPVWANDRWQLGSFQLGTAEIESMPGESCLIVFAEEDGVARPEMLDAVLLNGNF